MDSYPAAPMDYQAEDDMQTLLRAREIRADSGRLQRALACMKMKIDAMNEVQAESGEEAGEGE